MSSTSVTAPQLPGPADDALVARLTAEIAELEALSRFSVRGIAERAERVAAAAEGPELAELRLRAQLVGADMARCRGAHAEAGRIAQDISRQAVEEGRPFLRARSAYVLAAIFQELGDSATALEHAVDAVDLLDDGVPPELRIDHSLRLADCLGQHGDTSASLRYADVLALTHALGDGRRELVVLNNWAYIETLLGHFDEALPIAQQLEARSAELGEPLSVGRLDTLGRVLIGLDRMADAEAVLQPGLSPEALDSSTDGDAGADFLLTLAEVRRRLGRLAEARQALDDCVARCDRHGLTAIRVRARQEQAELHAAHGDHRAAFAEHKLFHQQLMELQSARRDARARTVQAMYETSEARRQSRRYRELSLRDPLTGLYNRRHIDEQLARFLGPGSLPAGALSVALVDLDHFKRINDSFGHDVGDAVLRRMADPLQAAVPADGARALGGSFAARMGGEEFLLVLIDTPPRQAAALAEDLRTAIAGHPWSDVTGDLPVTASIGVATVSGTVDLTPATLLSRADALLYRAKAQGRDRVITDAG
ncbi:GGDEF domain-containing protein [Blastococcus sp. TF02-09]|uniref:tetratricopeptide repeat-containing diguanylate cyclase n=1 Tax=Blastococcus sp. TF02-09 TaxID=2250576 RepID=UPI000DEB768B|nr:GGDEF domain-containing protein [Blastococcus sp. TF02-9]RBY81282.1 GGDEF domain-containing protein [Blastococcus sp. TF02-9]